MREVLGGNSRGKVKTNNMTKLSEIEKFAKAPWTPIPSLRFEELNHNEYSVLTSSINEQIRDSMYTLYPSRKISYVWLQFERLINSIFHDLQTIIDDETCMIVRIGTLHALQPKWLILCDMMLSVNNLGYSECHIFADRVDLLLFYSQQAETLVGTAIKYINCLFDSDLFVDLQRTKDVSIENGPIEVLYSGLFKTSVTDESIESCKTFLASLEYLSSELSECAYAQTYYLFKNTYSLYDNAERFQQQELSIYYDRRKIFIQDYNNALQTLGRREGVSNPDSSFVLKEKAFSETMLKLYSEVYQLYDINRGRLESLNDGIYTDEGWLRKFITDLFQTHYVGEQRDAEGNITAVFVNERGNTSIKGKSGWERWVDFLTVISLVRDYEQKFLSDTSSKLKNSANSSTQASVNNMEVGTLTVKNLIIDGKDCPHFPECLSIGDSTKLYEFLSREKFIDGKKTPLADFNYLMGAANQYTTPDGPKPIWWQRNKQMLREALKLSFAPLLKNGTTQKYLADLVPSCFVDMEGKPLALAKNDERQIVKQELDALIDFFTTISRPSKSD